MRPTSISSTNSTLHNLAVAFNIPALMFLFEHDHFTLAQSIEFELLGEGLTPSIKLPKIVSSSFQLSASVKRAFLLQNAQEFRVDEIVIL